MKCGLVVSNYNDFNTTEKLLNEIKNYDALNKKGLSRKLCMVYLLKPGLKPPTFSRLAFSKNFW